MYTKSTKKTLFDKLLQKDKQRDIALNKTITPNDLKKCTQFCKKDYIPNVNKTYNKMFNTTSPSKQLNQSMFYSCKKDYCNKTCTGFFKPHDRSYSTFRKNIRNGFTRKYSMRNIQKLKDRGALSGCFRNPDYKLV